MKTLLITETGLYIVKTDKEVKVYTREEWVHQSFIFKLKKWLRKQGIQFNDKN